MAFCPKCGAQADPSASFCNTCGSGLKSTEPREIVPPSMKEKGDTLEDAVADYLRRVGFDVERRVRLRDRFDVSHEIDVFGSKKEAFGWIRLAVECKYVNNPIDIKEVRNFHDKLTALGVTKGLFVSTGGFTADAESHARALGIELWDMSTLQNKIAESQIPQEGLIHDALPIDPAVVSALRPKHLRNSNLLSETLQIVVQAILLHRLPLFLPTHRGR